MNSHHLYPRQVNSVINVGSSAYSQILQLKGQEINDDDETTSNNVIKVRTCLYDFRVLCVYACTMYVYVCMYTIHVCMVPTYVSYMCVVYVVRFTSLGQHSSFFDWVLLG